MKMCKNPTCKQAGKYQPMQNFCRSPHHADKRASTCKECNARAEKKRYHALKESCK